MTVLVFNSDGLTAATELWTVAAVKTEDNVALMTPARTLNLEITMSEFLALIADGGKIVDLRKLQESK